MNRIDHAFLVSVPQDWTFDFDKLSQMIREISPDVQLSIRYGTRPCLVIIHHTTALSDDERASVQRLLDTAATTASNGSSA